MVHSQHRSRIPFEADGTPLTAILNLAGRAPRRVIVPMGVAALLALSLVGVAAGWELSLSVFYLVPLLVVAAAAGQRAAVVMAGAAALARVVVALLVAPVEVHALMPLAEFGSCFVTYWLVGGLVAALATKLREEQEAARVDSLTGLANARCFYERVERQRALLLSAPFVVAYFDVDNFKDVNDTRGHSGGDAALTEVGSTIARMLGEHDLAARIGGDEFIVLLPATNAVIGRELLAAIHETLIEEVGRRWGVGFSFGGVCCNGWQESLDALVHAADQAMYEAKRRAKGTMVIVDEDTELAYVA